MKLSKELGEIRKVIRYIMNLKRTKKLIDKIENEYEDFIKRAELFKRRVLMIK